VELLCRGTADCTATAWPMRPIAAPRMGHIGQTSSVLLNIAHSSPLNRLNDSLESGPMATVRWCRDAGATDASSPVPVLSEKGTESVWHRPLR
jgi:hypothetical protein